MFLRVWRNWNPYVLLVYCKMVQPLENSTEGTKKFENRTIVGFSNPISGYIVNRIESRFSKRYLHTQVHRNTVYNSQEVEATQYIFIDEYINKIWHIHTTEYYSAFKKMETVKCCNMDKFWWHYAKWNNPIIKRQMWDFRPWWKCRLICFASSDNQKKDKNKQT